MLCPALLCLRPPLGPESLGQGQSPASSLGPPPLRKALSPPRAATPLQTQGKHRGPADPGVAQRAPRPTSSRAGPPATATGRLGAGTDHGQERVPSSGPVPTLLAGLGWGPSSPLRPFPEHPRRQTVSPAHLGNDSHRGRGGRAGGEPSDPHPPHQTQDCSFSGLGLSWAEPSQPARPLPPSWADGRAVTSQASHRRKSQETLARPLLLLSLSCAHPPLASRTRQRQSAQVHLLQAQPRRTTV